MKHNTRLLQVSTFTAIALVLAGCTASETNDGNGTDTATMDDRVSERDFPPDSTMAELQERGSLNVGTKTDQPLVGQMNLDGDLEGFEVEISKMIAAGLGIPSEEINWMEASTANRAAFIDQGQVDWVAASYAITPERQENTTFAGPHISSGQQIVVLAGNPENIQQPEDMDGRAHCTITGATAPDDIEPYADPEWTFFDEISGCFNALSQGRVDGLQATGAALAGYVAENPDDYEFAFEPFTVQEWGIGIQKGDVEFCEFINETLEEAEASGAYEAAWEETLGQSGLPAGPLPESVPCE